MNKQRFDMIVKQFPVLKNFQPFPYTLTENVNNISIERADAQLMHRKANEYTTLEDNDFVRIFACWQEKGAWQIHEFACAGVELDETGQQKEWDAPAVGEQLYRKHLEPEVIIVATQTKGPRRIWRSIVIHRINNFNTIEYQLAEIDRAAQQLKEEMTKLYREPRPTNRWWKCPVCQSEINVAEDVVPFDHDLPDGTICTGRPVPMDNK